MSNNGYASPSTINSDKMARRTKALELASALVGHTGLDSATMTVGRGILDALKRCHEERLLVYVTVLLECPGMSVHRIAEDIFRTLYGDDSG